MSDTTTAVTPTGTSATPAIPTPAISTPALPTAAATTDAATDAAAAPDAVPPAPATRPASTSMPPDSGHPAGSNRPQTPKEPTAAKRKSGIPRVLVLRMRRRSSVLLCRVGAFLRRDDGMSTAEYAVGTVAAVAFSAALYKVVTSDVVTDALSAVIGKALNATF
ncbi:DUF4244 domain-containing protein [Streptomycetaceae bacterium NBC_01309]